jgi:hypothetical protein
MSCGIAFDLIQHLRNRVIGVEKKPQSWDKTAIPNVGFGVEESRVLHPQSRLCERLVTCLESKISASREHVFSMFCDEVHLALLGKIKPRPRFRINVQQRSAYDTPRFIIQNFPKCSGLA